MGWAFWIADIVLKSINVHRDVVNLMQPSSIYNFNIHFATIIIENNILIPVDIYNQYCRVLTILTNITLFSESVFVYSVKSSWTSGDL